MLVEQLRARLAGAPPVLVAAFASTAQPLGEVVGLLKQAFPGATVLGASTAGEFTERGDAKRSVAAIAVAGDLKLAAGMGTGLRASPQRTLDEALRQMSDDLYDSYTHRTAILLLDPLAGNGEETSLLASAMLGEDVRLVGGAAGDDLKMASTQVALDGHAASDAAVVAIIHSHVPLGIGVSHGHQALSRPLKVTRSVGNVVYQVEDRPAWDVWLEHTRESARERGLLGTSFSPVDEGAYLLQYEAGLSTGNGFKVRAPLSRAAGGAINFACGIPEGAVIRITESTPERQVASAREAARRARLQLGDSHVAGALVFDCICRKLILGEQFSDAVRRISRELGDAPLAGFETYGEIALDVGEMSGFHNTTSVVLAFPEE